MFDYIEDPDIRAKALEEYKEASEKDAAGLKKKNGEVIAEQKRLKEALALVTDKLEDFDGVDIKEHKRVMAQIKEENMKKLLSDEKYSEVIDLKVGEVESTYKLKLEEAIKVGSDAVKELNQFKSNHQRLQLDSMVKDEALKHGVRKDALSDLTRRASDTFKPKGDSFVALNANGEEVPSKTGDGSGLTMTEWLEGLREESPYFFENPKGGGQRRGEGPAPTDFAKMSEADQRKALDANPDLGKSLPVHP